MFKKIYPWNIWDTQYAISRQICQLVSWEEILCNMENVVILIEGLKSCVKITIQETLAVYSCIWHGF